MESGLGKSVRPRPNVKRLLMLVSWPSRLVNAVSPAPRLLPDCAGWLELEVGVLGVWTLVL